MAALKRELTIAVRWPNHAEDRSVLAPAGVPLPFETDAVVGRQEVGTHSGYELELLAGSDRILHVSGALPRPKAMSEGQTVVAADAWVRCRIEEDSGLHYEVHLGPAGMDQPKACHKGRVVLNR